MAVSIDRLNLDRILWCHGPYFYFYSGIGDENSSIVKKMNFMAEKFINIKVFSLSWESQIKKSPKTKIQDMNTVFLYCEGLLKQQEYLPNAKTIIVMYENAIKYFNAYMDIRVQRIGSTPLKDKSTIKNISHKDYLIKTKIYNCHIRSKKRNLLQKKIIIANDLIFLENILSKIESSENINEICINDNGIHNIKISHNQINIADTPINSLKTNLNNDKSDIVYSEINSKFLNKNNSVELINKSNINFLDEKNKISKSESLIISCKQNITSINNLTKIKSKQKHFREKKINNFRTESIDNINTNMGNKSLLFQNPLKERSKISQNQKKMNTKYSKTKHTKFVKISENKNSKAKDIAICQNININNFKLNLDSSDTESFQNSENLNKKKNLLGVVESPEEISMLKNNKSKYDNLTKEASLENISTPDYPKVNISKDDYMLNCLNLLNINSNLYKNIIIQNNEINKIRPYFSKVILRKRSKRGNIY